MSWLVSTLRAPEFVRDDPRRQGIKLAFGRVKEIGDRWLRVAYVEKPTEIVVVTAMFDRKAEKWR